ncbi:hypothetical protein F7725_026659 [Dissostichus mawsoni]|uniref:Uncharacterized protein n=1 Tax=Dissostichus mawsoni TaxID=36200 RepID=A0A7J5X7N0_DISMA|nr:hypothetical protein F7725_026659 [Dissostichus mawsoni]
MSFILPEGAGRGLLHRFPPLLLWWTSLCSCLHLPIRAGLMVHQGREPEPEITRMDLSPKTITAAVET